MTYTNYPFNAIWAIVKLSRLSSRTFPATLTQKHQFTSELTPCGHRSIVRGRVWNRSCQNWSSIQRVEWQGVRARASLWPATDYSQLNGRSAEGRSSHRLTPSELTKITNCDCPLIKRGNFTLQRHTCSFDTRRAGAAGALDTCCPGMWLEVT